MLRLARIVGRFGTVRNVIRRLEVQMISIYLNAVIATILSVGMGNVVSEIIIFLLMIVMIIVINIILIT